MFSQLAWIPIKVNYREDCRCSSSLSHQVTEPQSKNRSRVCPSFVAWTQFHWHWKFWLGGITSLEFVIISFGRKKWHQQNHLFYLLLLCSKGIIFLLLVYDYLAITDFLHCYHIKYIFLKCPGNMGRECGFRQSFKLLWRLIKMKWLHGAEDWGLVIVEQLIIVHPIKCGFADLLVKSAGVY